MLFFNFLEPELVLFDKLTPDILTKLNNVDILIDNTLQHTDIESIVRRLQQKSKDNGEERKIEWNDFRVAQHGDLCLAENCNGTGRLKANKGIELGHIFYLGTKYSSKLNANITYQSQTSAVEMGCYGLGITRILASIVETWHDSHGIKWPLSVAPYKVLCYNFIF